MIEFAYRPQTALSGICGSDPSAVSVHDPFTLEPFGAYLLTLGHENVVRLATGRRGRC